MAVKNYPHLSSATLVATLMLAANLGVAQQLDEEKSGIPLQQVENGWEITLGAGVAARSGFLYLGDDEEYDKLGPLLVADISYQRNDFFAVLSERDVALGYTVWSARDWTLDAVLSPKLAGFLDDNDALASQDEQDLDLHLGGRLTRYADASRFSIELSNDIANVHSSYIASVTYLREWQHRNWLFSSQLSASYLSSDVTQYYYGVDASEATNRFPEFRSNGGVIVGADLRVDYPLTEHWIFRASASAITVTDNIKDSPIIDDSTILEMNVGVNYVF